MNINVDDNEDRQRKKEEMKEKRKVNELGREEKKENNKHVNGMNEKREGLYFLMTRKMNKERRKR